MKIDERIKLAISKGYSCSPDTGEIFGIKGNRIGHINSDGYEVFSIKYNNLRFFIKSHQFIYYYVNRLIVDCIDHIDRNRTNNRINNLRSVTKQQNSFNSFGIGYSINKNGKYEAKIKVNYKTIYLGSFNTKEEASNAYLNAKKLYHMI
jgi:hypothetical protein